MRPILLIIISLWLCPLTVSAQNLLFNPSASFNTTTRWIITPANSVRATASVNEATGIVQPYDTGYFFTFTAVATQATMTQDVDITGHQFTPYLAAGMMMQNELYETGIDTGELIITFFDNDMNQLAQYTTGETAFAIRGDQAIGPDAYAHFGLVLPKPFNAATLRYQIVGRLHAGSYINTFVDNLYVTPLDNPADFNRDGMVNLIDFAAFAGNWLTQQSSQDFDPTYDIATPPNGTIDINDLADFSQLWLTLPLIVE